MKAKSLSSNKTDVGDVECVASGALLLPLLRLLGLLVLLEERQAATAQPVHYRQSLEDDRIVESSPCLVIPPPQQCTRMDMELVVVVDGRVVIRYGITVVLNLSHFVHTVM